MNFKEIEDYWIETAKDTFDSAIKLYEQGKYVHSLFFLHLAIEKMIKAVYVNRNKEEAPYGHSLQVLISKIKDAVPGNEQLKFFTEVTTFNIAARYNDYKRSFYKTCDESFALNYLDKGKEIMQWLQFLLI